MKQITLVNIGLPDKTSVYTDAKKFTVFLGNETRYYFTSFKAAKQFLAETNRFLNAQFHEINYIYINLFMEYRNIWFYLKGRENIDKQITNSMEAIAGYLENACSKSKTINGNVFTFNHLFAACNELDEVARFIIIVLTAKKRYNEVHRVKMFKSQVESIRDRLISYGKK